MPEDLAERVVRELSEGIGPRLGGSERSHREPVCFPIFMPPPPEYHQPTDTAAIVDQAKLATIIDIVDAVARELDRLP